jgi:hypothetical protein
MRQIDVQTDGTAVVTASTKGVPPEDNSEFPSKSQLDTLEDRIEALEAGGGASTGFTATIRFYSISDWTFMFIPEGTTNARQKAMYSDTGSDYRLEMATADGQDEETIADEWQAHDTDISDKAGTIVRLYPSGMDTLATVIVFGVQFS